MAGALERILPRFDSVICSQIVPTSHGAEELRNRHCSRIAAELYDHFAPYDPYCDGREGRGQMVEGSQKQVVQRRRLPRSGIFVQQLILTLES